MSETRKCMICFRATADVFVGLAAFCSPCDSFTCGKIKEDRRNAAKEKRRASALDVADARAWNDELAPHPFTEPAPLTKLKDGFRMLNDA